MSEKKVVKATEKPKKKVVEATENRVDEKLQNPGKYEVTEDSMFTVEFWLAKVDDRWLLTDPAKNGKTEKHWVEFRFWGFEEEIDLRKKSTSYDATKRMHFVDHDRFNRLKVQKLLKRWSFEKDNPRLKLLHVNGVLVDEGWKAFTQLHTNISRYIVERMNAVLEYNG